MRVCSFFLTLCWRGDTVDEDNGEHHTRNKSIEPVALMQEIDEREEHAHDGCEEQGYDAHLYDTRCLEVKEPAKDAAQRRIVGM